MRYPIGTRRSTVLFAALSAAALALSACRSDESAAPKETPPPEETATATPMPAGSGATLRGRITIDGPVPPRVTRTVAGDPELCGSDPIVDREMVVDPVSHGVRYAVVTLVSATAGTATPAAPVTREVEQVKCDYFPYISVVPPGSRVIVRNSDDALHDVHVLPESGTTGANHSLRPDGKVELTMTDPGRVRLACDLHYWAKAWLIVDDAPHAAITDAEGRYSFAGVPPGSWRLTVWHERLGTAVRDVVVSEKDATEDVALPPPAPSRPKPK